MNKTARFLNQLDAFARKSIPDMVRSRIRESLLDYIGVLYAGITYSACKNKVLINNFDEGDSLAIGLGKRLSLGDAAFMNGLNAHMLDFDDGANAGIIHLGSPIFSVLIPLAQKSSTSLEDLLHAAVIGYEAAWTLAFSIQPMHKLMGYHASGTCGMLGAVIAASYMLGYSEEEKFKAFSTALCSTTGTLKVLEDQSGIKPYNVAKASLLSISALNMAIAGFDVPNDAMSGDRGFLKLASGSEKTDIVNPFYEDRYAVMRTYTKPYAACRYCHPAIDAAIKLRKRIIRTDDISAIEVRTYDLAVNKHDHIAVNSESSAKMSIPYGVAVGLIYGAAGLRQYVNAATQNAEIARLSSLVKVESDDEMSAAFPGKTIARLTLTLEDGSVIEELIEHPKGEPSNPMSLEEITSKFHDLMVFSGASEEFIDCLQSCILDYSDSAEFYSLLQRSLI